MAEHNEQYDKTMLHCLQVTGFRKTKAIQLFVQQFPNATWMRSYCYKVYERVMEKLHTAPEMQKLTNELVCNLRFAHDAALEQALNGHNWEPFKEISNLIIRASGMDKQVTNVNVNNNTLHMSKPPEAIADRIKELEQSIANRISPAIGGVQPAVISQPVVEVQTS